jgi:steroid delta-isomerase-like uncharacterized protein
MGSTATDLGREGVEAFNAGDWDRLRDTLAPDAEYDEPGTQRQAHGQDEIVAINRGWKEAFPDAHGTITSAFGTDEDAALEITWEGTHTGTLASPMGDVPPTHRRVMIKASQLIRAPGGKVQSTHHYFDVLGMMAQLGLMPETAGAQR